MLNWDQPRNLNPGLCADAHHGWRNVLAPVRLGGAAGLSTMANSCSVMSACSCSRKCRIRLTNRSFMRTSPIFMLFRKSAAKAWAENCWRKHYHGVALSVQMALFCGRVQEANRFIASAAWPNRRIFSNCDTLRIHRARALGKIAANCRQDLSQF